MAWQINELFNTLKINKSTAKKLFDAQDYEGELWDSVDQIIDRDGVLYFNEDHMEHMDYLSSHENMLKILKKDKVSGAVAFADLEGDDKGSYWGYSFDGVGGLKILKNSDVLKMLDKSAAKVTKKAKKSTKYSKQDLVDIIEQEGSLEYAVRHYVNANEIEDKELRELWQQAFEVLEAIEARLPTERT